jgi:hypothetical protein
MLDQTTIDTVDAFVAGLFVTIDAAQTTYQQTEPDDRYKSEKGVFDVVPSGSNSRRNRDWSLVSLPLDMPCDLVCTSYHTNKENGYYLIAYVKSGRNTWCRHYIRRGAITRPIQFRKLPNTDDITMQ